MHGAGHDPLIRCKNFDIFDKPIAHEWVGSPNSNATSEKVMTMSDTSYLDARRVRRRVTCTYLAGHP